MPRPVSGKFKQLPLNKDFQQVIVSVELGESQDSTAQSPQKSYAALSVTSPSSSQPAINTTSPIEQPLCIDDGIEVVTEVTSPNFQASATVNKNSPAQEEEQASASCTWGNPEAVATPIKTMEVPSSKQGCATPGGLQALVSTQAFPFSLDQYLSPAVNEEINPDTPHQEEQEDELEAGTMDFQSIDQTDPREGDFTVATFTTLSVPRQQIVTVSRVLEQIPESFITGEGLDSNQVLGLTVVDENMPSTMITTSSQEDISMPSTSGTAPRNSQQTIATHGKRRRPKYSFTVSMLKKHPVLQFSATGPLDPNKSLHKWCCRVCKVELSLMSRGVLELISHYRTDTHLVKEHRIRMEVPGMSLYAKDEKELLGIALQAAKRIAKETHPIVQQMDSHRPLVGQDTVPCPSIESSPTEKVLFQISIIEFGLRHGGACQ